MAIQLTLTRSVGQRICDSKVSDQHGFHGNQGCRAMRQVKAQANTLLICLTRLSGWAPLPDWRWHDYRHEQPDVGLLGRQHCSSAADLEMAHQHLCLEHELDNVGTG